MASGDSRILSDVFFEPFEEVKKELTLIPHRQDVSLAKHMYTDDAEDSINQQIKLFFFSDRFVSSTFSSSFLLFPLFFERWMICYWIILLCLISFPYDLIFTVLNTIFRMCTMLSSVTSTETTSLSRDWPSKTLDLS